MKRSGTAKATEFNEGGRLASGSSAAVSAHVRSIFKKKSSTWSDVCRPVSNRLATASSSETRPDYLDHLRHAPAAPSLS
jgi:hypothetical protein